MWCFGHSWCCPHLEKNVLHSATLSPCFLGDWAAKWNILWITLPLPYLPTCREECVLWSCGKPPSCLPRSSIWRCQAGHAGGPHSACEACPEKLGPRDTSPEPWLGLSRSSKLVPGPRSTRARAGSAPASPCPASSSPSCWAPCSVSSRGSGRSCSQPESSTFLIKLHLTKLFGAIYRVIFSYASSSTLYSCHWVSESVSELSFGLA